MTGRTAQAVVKSAATSTKIEQIWLSLYAKAGLYHTANYASVKEARRFGRLWLSTNVPGREWKIIYENQGTLVEEMSNTGVVVLSCTKCRWTDRLSSIVDQETLDSAMAKHRAHHDRPVSKRFFKGVFLTVVVVGALVFFCAKMGWL